MTDRDGAFPFLDEPVLRMLPNASTAKDMERILTSPNSEDWVTWNLLRALQRTHEDGWRPRIVAAAKANAGPSARWGPNSAVPAHALGDWYDVGRYPPPAG